MSLKKDEAFDLKHLDNEIDKMNALISSANSNIELSQYWGLLGIYLQIKDARFHTSGAQLMKEEALHAFKTSLSLLNPDNPQSIKVYVVFHHRMAMLLKMMGRGDDAIESHKIVFNYSTHSYDKWNGLFHHGEALTMLARIKEAKKYY